MAARPFRAHVFLPGHGERGERVLVRKVSAASQEALDTILERYRVDGYWIGAWEECALPLETSSGEPLDG